jgi:hypothetical protein
MKWISYLFILVLFITTACEQDPPCYPLIEGCTDSLAINFFSDANIPSDDCEYATDKFVGTYLITDSVFGGMTADYFQREYEMVILKDSENPNKLLVQHWSFSHYNYQVMAEVDSTLFTVSNHIYTDPDWFETAGEGYIKGDSIFFTYYLLNLDWWAGKCTGVKID